MKKGNQRKEVENWKNDVPELNWIHKNKEKRNVKHEIHKAKLRQSFSFADGINKRKNTPIKGVKEVSIKGFKSFRFIKKDYVILFEF